VAPILPIFSRINWPQRMYCVLYFTLEKKNISDWPKNGPVETRPTGPVATPLYILHKV